MAFTKVWNSTSSGDYTNAANWKAISVRNSSYSWTASGSGTNEYYLRTAASGDPGFGAKPGIVLINGVEATEGTVGSLSAGQWGYDDNDTLGYNTIYVRLSDGADPDSKALDYVQFKQIPQASEDVRIPAGTASITTNLDNSGTTLASFIVESGYEGIIGSASAYLRVSTSRFEFAGNDIAYIDLGSTSVDPQVLTTATPGTGERGLYLLGSAIGICNIISGHVGIAVRGGETATVTTVRLVESQATCWIGAGCSLTNWHQYDGTGDLRSAGTITAVLVYAGELMTSETVAITTLTQKGGTVIPNSSGTITTYNLYGGSLDLRRSGVARTISTLNKYSGSATIRRNKEAVTITTETYQDTVDETLSPAS